jgi:hypothetical protein
VGVQCRIVVVGRRPNWRYIQHAFWTPSFLIYF